jgi:hypothetical protein
MNAHKLNWYILSAVINVSFAITGTWSAAKPGSSWGRNLEFGIWNKERNLTAL